MASVCAVKSDYTIATTRLSAFPTISVFVVGVLAMHLLPQITSKFCSLIMHCIISGIVCWIPDEICQSLTKKMTSIRSLIIHLHLIVCSIHDCICQSSKLRDSSHNPSELTLLPSMCVSSGLLGYALTTSSNLHSFYIHSFCRHRDFLSHSGRHLSELVNSLHIPLHLLFSCYRCISHIVVHVVGNTQTTSNSNHIFYIHKLCFLRDGLL